MMEESLKYDFSLFQRITNALLINSAFIDNIGLMHGKMGMAIFFAHLYRETNDPFFEKIFNILIDEVFDEITITTPPDFEDGLAGIGWGIEYLAQRGFIEADTDEVLESIDRKVSQILSYDVDNIGLLTGYCGYGFYLIKRINSGDVGRKKEKSDELERLLESIIAEIDHVIMYNKIDFSEPKQFDLCWDVIVLLLFINEVASIDKYASWAKSKEEFLSTIINIPYESSEIRLAIIILANNLKNIDNDLDLLASLSESIRLHKVSRGDGFLRFIALFGTLLPEYNISDFNGYIRSLCNDLIGIEDKLISVCSKWRNTKDLGFLEGICGIGLFLLSNHVDCGFNIYRTNEVSKALFEHPNVGQSRVKVVFVPYEHSGAGTYKHELISYLKEEPEVELYILNISSDIGNYSVEKVDRFINVKIPIIDNVANICDSGLRNYFLRLIELLKNDLVITENTIFHFNDNLDYKFFVPLIKKELKGKVVLTYHFLSERATVSLLKRELLSDTNDKETGWSDYNIGNTREFDSVICVSHFAQKVLTESSGIPMEKTTVIWNGTSSWKPLELGRKEKAELKHYFGFNPELRIILYSGRLEPRKGIEELLGIIGELCCRYDDLHFVFAGNGRFEDYLPMCTNFLGRITFTGNLNKEDLQRLYHLADIGIVPSRWEIFGYVPIEMMHSGLPVIATNVPGMNEIFNRLGSNKYLAGVELGDCRNRIKVDKVQLYDLICSSLDNPVSLNKYANRGLICAKKYFSRQNMGEKTMDFYYKVLNN